MLIEDAEKILSGFQLFRFEVIGEQNLMPQQPGLDIQFPTIPI